MAFYSDVGKDITDQFTKDNATAQNVEVTAKFNQYFSFVLKGNFASASGDASFAPTLKVADYGLEVKPEFFATDANAKTLKVDVTVNDLVVKGLKLDVGTFDGKKGETSAGLSYKNSKFGGVTGKLTLPEGKDKFVTPTLYVETSETKGFGVGATAKVVLGEATSVESWRALGAFKNAEVSAFLGVEKKVDEEAVKAAAKKAEEEAAKAKAEGKELPKVVKAPLPTNLLLVGGVLKKYGSNKSFGVNGSVNLKSFAPEFEFLWKKTYEDSTFVKLRADLKGVVGVSKQFKPNGVTAVLGANVNISKATGNVGFQLSTDL